MDVVRISLVSYAVESGWLYFSRGSLLVGRGMVRLDKAMEESVVSMVFAGRALGDCVAREFWTIRWQGVNGVVGVA